MTDVCVVPHSFPEMVAVAESKTPRVTLAILADIIAGGVPGVGVKNAQGPTCAYQGHRFLQVAIVFMSDEPQRRLAFFNRFWMNPELDLLVIPIIRR